MSDSDDCKDTSLHEAVRYGDLDEVRQAVKEGLNPNQIGLYQWSPLHEAAHNGDQDILKLLLKHRGDPNKPDKLKGCTAVHYAAKEGHVECLRLLLQAGGRYDARNKEGDTVLDLTTDECEQILQEYMVKDLIQKSRKEAKDQLLLEQARKIKAEQAKRAAPLIVEKDPEVLEPRKEASGVSAWNEFQKAKEKEKKDESGYLQLSFEYNAKKSTLKARVWQICDLLLPPPEVSMISTIYVKSYLIPDKTKDSKRKTEEVKVEGQHGQTQEVKIAPKAEKHKYQVTNVQTVFKPTNFKFAKPLEYTGITKEAVKEKSIDLQVFVTQKYSRKSFIVAFVKLPLSVAVKKLVREKFLLKPCMADATPANMKVYSAGEVTVQQSYRNFSSNPNLRNPSLVSLHVTPAERAASDTNLRRVKVENLEKVPSIEIPIPEKDSLPEIRVEEYKVHYSKSTTDLTKVHIPGEISSDEPENVVIDKGRRTSKHEVKVMLHRRKSASTPELSNTDSEMSELDSSVNSQQGAFRAALMKQQKDELSQLEKGRSPNGKRKGKRSKNNKETIELKSLDSALIDRHTHNYHSTVTKLDLPGVHTSPSYTKHQGAKTVTHNARRLPSTTTEKIKQSGALDIHYEDDLTGEKNKNHHRHADQPKPVRDYGTAKSPTGQRKKTTSNSPRVSSPRAHSRTSSSQSNISSISQSSGSTVISL